MGKHIKINIGDKFKTRSFGEVTVVSIDSYSKITVAFSDGTLKVAAAGELRKGSVKNQMFPSIYGVGYMGIGDFPAGIRGGVGAGKEYRVWHSMLQRCYKESAQKKNPTYVGCSVAFEWHNFQTFAAWYSTQEGAKYGWHLDKDLTVLGNKVYSAATCALVPRDVNNLFTLREADRGTLPLGVSLYRDGVQYVASLSVGSGSKYLGLYSTVESAFNAYKCAKIDHVRDTAEKYKCYLSTEVYNNLVNYTPTTED